MIGAINGGGIYTSWDRGASWTVSSAPVTNWASVACSRDGTRLVAAAGGEQGPGVVGPIYVSTNAGAGWKLTTAPFSSWNSVASSADGSVLVACQYEPAPLAFGLIYTSTNYGDTWQPGDSEYCWFSAAASADGNTLAVVGTVNVYQHGNFGEICISTNRGATWTNFNSSAEAWTCIASSADGNQFVTGNFQPGTISIFTNTSFNWNDTPAPTQNWSSVASSADGSKLLAAANGFLPSPAGPIYTSPDYGRTWISNNAPVTNWSGVASSADGNTLVAGVNGGGIYTWQTISTPVLSSRVSASDLLLCWTVPSMNFVVEQSPDLTSGKWVTVPVTPSLNYTNLQYQVSIPRPQGTMFYRLASQ